MRLALAQINTTVGDLDGNRERILTGLAEAKETGADIALFPELAVTGYPPEDLLLRPSFVRAAERSLAQIAREARGIVAFVGVPHLDRDLYNACAVCAAGEVKALYRKRFLPNYGVFDEHRYFAPGRDLFLLEHGEALIGPTVCEDIWQPGPPATDLALAGAQLLVNISASPFHVGKDREREQMLATRARDNVCYVAFVNAVGGQDELIFDGHSVVLDDEGQVLARAPGFDEALLIVDVEPEEVVGRRLRDVRRRSLESEREEAPEVPVFHIGSPRAANGQSVEPELAPLLDDLEQMRRALELGLRDYVQKNGFEQVVIGVSGGIDSALAAAIASQALGADRVHCVSMPSRFSSEETRRDAGRLAEGLGADFLELPIEPIVVTFLETLADVFAGREPDTTEENLQARIRGVLLMALSNKFGWLVVATGNKSELSVGYATLYGDMAGGFALLKDVFKTDVFRLARYLNQQAGREVIPQSIIDRAPSAELRDNQLDEDSLPPYPALDQVLEAYVELDRSREDLTTDGFDPDVVDRALAMIDRAEYKRRQAPPGVKLRPKAFGRDWRLPITNRWRG
ncbi:MAG TPA: NAD+ synthase [Gaiellaceae bacterium]|jgi:NAD+ synthase (glutamine-hydrolysing)|nr:NAD+ synthase [Gaiellaceae bacterium]